MEILFLILLLIVLIGNIIFLVTRNISTTSTAPLMILLGYTFILFLFSLFNALLIGLYLVFAAALATAVLGYFTLFKEKESSKKLFDLPFFVFILIFAAAWFYTRYTLFWSWDEFSHWGVAYKYTMLTNRIPTEPGVVIVSYPPFAPLFQYLISKVIGFDESNAYFAQMLVIFFSLLAALPKPQEKKNIIFYLLGFIFSGISIHAFGYWAQSLYVDLLMAVLLGCALVYIVVKDDLSLSTYICVLFPAAALALIKPTGILFSLLIAVSFIVKNFVFSAIEKPFIRLLKQKKTVFSLILLLLPLFALLSWNMVSTDTGANTTKLTLRSSGITQEEIFPLYPYEYEMNLIKEQNEFVTQEKLFGNAHKTISVEEVIKSFTLATPYRSRYIFRKMIKDIGRNHFFDKEIHFSVIHCFVLFGLLILFETTFLKHNQQEKDRKQLMVQHGILLAGFIGYFLFLYLSYVFIFYPYEATYAPSLARYLGTYLLAWWILILTVQLRMIFSDKTAGAGWKLSARGIFGFIVVLIFIGIPTVKYIHLPKEPQPERFLTYRIYKMVGDIFTEEDKVFHIWQEDETTNGFEHYLMRYFLTPVPSNMHGWMMGERYSNNDLYTAEITPKEWLDLLNNQEYTYVLVSIADNNFWEHYGVLFNEYQFSPNVLIHSATPQLFRVTSTGLVLTPLDTQEGN